MLHPDDPQIVVLKHKVWRVKGIIQVNSLGFLICSLDLSFDALSAFFSFTFFFLINILFIYIFQHALAFYPSVCQIFSGFMQKYLVLM